jgi:hypothetical protein
MPLSQAGCQEATGLFLDLKLRDLLYLHYARHPVQIGRKSKNRAGTAGRDELLGVDATPRYL